MTAMARHVPLLLALIVALFLVAPLAIIVPMSFSKAVSFEFPPPGYWTGYYAQYFASHSWLEATANSFIIAFGVDGVHADRGAARRVRLRALSLPRQERPEPVDDAAADRARRRERARLLRFPEPDASRRHPCRHDHRAQRVVDTGRLSGDRSGAQGLRPQSRTCRHERGRRPAAHLPLGDVAGAAARDPGRRPVRVPALVQRGGGGDLHCRPRRVDPAQEDVRIDPPRIRSRDRRGIEPAHRRGAARRARLPVLRQGTAKRSANAA